MCDKTVSASIHKGTIPTCYTALNYDTVPAQEFIVGH